jgi:beta-glucosidase
VVHDGAEPLVHAAFTITNSGGVAGKEVAQLYVVDDQASVFRPEKELKGFQKVALGAGESARVEITLDARAFSFWHPVLREWVVEPGTFTLLVGASSRDIRLRGTIQLQGQQITRPLDADSTAEQWLAHPVLGPRLRHATEGTPLAEMLFHPESGRMMRAIPMRRLARFPVSRFTEQWLEETARAAR